MDTILRVRIRRELSVILMRMQRIVSLQNVGPQLITIGK